MRGLLVLDIGCGPDGVINYIEEADRCGLDPLMDFYVKNSNLSRDIDWVKGTGERIPFESDSFDIVISTNALDHMHNPIDTINDMSDILKKTGVMLISVTCYSPPIKQYRLLRENAGMGDVFHPHTFHVSDVIRLIENSGCRVISVRKVQSFKKNNLLNILKAKELKTFLSRTFRRFLSLFYEKITSRNEDGTYMFIASKE